MARFERSRGNDSRGSSPRRGGRSDFSDRRRGDSDREPKRFSSRTRRDLEMTKVTCSSCGIECEVPFKPTSSKPVFCSDCFKKNDKGGKQSNLNLDEINEKLDKIMNALDIK